MNRFKHVSIVETITDREKRSVADYFAEVRNYPLLSPEEEQALGRRIAKGDRQAFDKLVLHNLRFVVTIAKKYQGPDVCFEDLLQAGNEGLMKAASKYDYRKGRFTTFASCYVKSEVLQAKMNYSRIVNYSSNAQRTLLQLSRLKSKMEQEQSGNVSSAEVVHALLGDNASSSMLGFSDRVQSLDEPFSHDGEDFSAIDMLRSDDSFAADSRLNHEALSITLNHAMSQLTTKRREVLEMLYGIGYQRSYSYGEVADNFNMTDVRIRQIERESLHTLCHGHCSRQLRGFCS